MWANRIAPAQEQRDVEVAVGSDGRPERIVRDRRAPEDCAPARGEVDAADVAAGGLDAERRAVLGDVRVPSVDGQPVGGRVRGEARHWGSSRPAGRSPLPVATGKSEVDDGS